MTAPTATARAPGLPPWAVAALRGLLEAIILAVIGWAIVALGDVHAGALAPFAPIAILALRQAEGIVDQRIDPTRQRTTGGAPATRTVTAPIVLDTTAVVDELAARLSPSEERRDRPLRARQDE